MFVFGRASIGASAKHSGEGEGYRKKITGLFTSCVNACHMAEWFRDQPSAKLDLIVPVTLCARCAGTMSGGGSRVSKGRMCSAFVSDVTPEQLTRMEQKMQKESSSVEVGRTGVRQSKTLRNASKMLVQDLT